MINKSIIIQIAILVCFVILRECIGNIPYINLEKNTRFFQVRVSIRDLALFGFDDQTTSITYHGVYDNHGNCFNFLIGVTLSCSFILYEYKDYNAEHPDGAAVARSDLRSNSRTNESTGPLDVFQNTSSVRVIGYNPSTYHYNSITLFENKNFGGLRTELLVEVYANKTNLIYSNYKSVVIVGDSSWTFYDELDFGGRGDCIRGADDSTAAKFLKDSLAIGFLLNGKRSVQEGCYSAHGVLIAK